MHIKQVYVFAAIGNLRKCE